MTTAQPHEMLEGVTSGTGADGFVEWSPTSILGTRVARVEDPRFLTVGGTYVDDVVITGAVWATFVRSVVAHGDVVKIDVAAASRAPGVLGVFVAEDLDLRHAPLDFPVLPDTMPRPLLAGPPGPLWGGGGGGRGGAER